MPTMRPLLCLLLCGWCGAVPLVSSSSGRQGAPPAGRQVAPSQQILGELQYLFRQAAAGQQPPAEYGAAREELDQMLAGLDQLAAVVPSAQHQPPVQPAAPTMTTEQPADKPIIDPGLFVIQGVQTCGAGAGYCVLGYNCSSDNDFEDDASGHCHGLRTAFTPSVEFSCCRFDAERRRTATPRPTPTTTEGTTFDDGLVDSIVNFGDEMPEEPHGENSQIVDIVAIITDSTGIVDIVTRPYTGPWPPSEEQGGGAVTLPFAKPGETFEPGSMVGLGQNNVNLGTTSLPPAPDAFQAGDLPPPEEEASLPAGADVLLTTAATTPASVATSTPPGEPSTAAAEPPPQQLGPLANVPVMDQNLDYIGDVDYDQHLLPALMPIRPGTKAGGVEATLEGSGDAPAPGDDLLPLAADVAIEGSGSGAEAEAEAEAMHEQAPEESTPAPQIPADAVTAERPAGAVTATPEEDAAQTGGASGSGASAERPPSTQPAAELEEFKAGSAQETELKAPPQNAHGSVALSAAMGSLSTSVRPPVCGMMGSSLASLLARSRYRHRGADSGAPRLGGEVTSTVVWCWMAAVLRRTHDPDQPYRFVCAGSLVERDLVLTTASCASRLFKEPLRDFVVLLGASNLRVSLEFGVQHMELQEIIIHENYQIDSDVHSNDIGLLKLSRPATLDRTVCLLCLPPEGMELTARQSCSVTGYGLAEAQEVTADAEQDSPLETPGVLRQTSMPVLPRAECGAVQRLALRRPALDDRDFLCAGGQRSADACYIARDGGSPLACMAASGRYYLYGVVSWAADCDDDAEPQMYTSVANYFTWIRRNYERMTMKFSLRSDAR